ncbi:MAG TPA: ABC transporter ATP-binding protein [Terriglobia bacterium]|nr:ABC transporter ATP-binding protein [Terriglobia bacterium]
MSLIRLDDVRFSYSDHPVLRGVSLSIHSGERVAILGANGAGKTTFLKLLSGTLAPTTGSILMGEGDLHCSPRSEVARRIAVVPQEFVVPFAFTTGEIVELGRTPHLRPLRGLRSEDRLAVRRAMQLTDTAALAGRVFNELSGGERQRAVLAMALAQEPEILLLDEPTQQLDITRQAEILDLVSDLNVCKNLTVVAAIHDLNLAGRYFERLVVLHRGTVLEDGTPQVVLRPEVLANAYGGPVEVLKSLAGGTPVVFPVSRFHNAGSPQGRRNAGSAL